MGVSQKRASSLTKMFASVAAAAVLLGAAGCTSMPVTGGRSSPLNSDTVQNAEICLTYTEAKAKAASIPVGTTKADVYSAFGIKSESDTLRQLTKEEVNRALYGQPMLNINFEQREDAQKFANSLEGYAVTCRNIHSARRFGFTHTEVEKTGYEYTLQFIFREGKLYDPVSVPGAPVKTKDKDGYLNSLNPVDLGVKAARGGL
jgi:outer membrane protein assembly factor BamE (lipoprotein component of BamABCDE complex)